MLQIKRKIATEKSVRMIETMKYTRDRMNFAICLSDSVLDMLCWYVCLNESLDRLLKEPWLFALTEFL